MAWLPDAVGTTTIRGTLAVSEAVGAALAALRAEEKQEKANG